MKFILFVEGYTEYRSLSAFLKKWLDPKLNKPIGIKVIRFDGWNALYNETPLKAEMHLNATGNEEIIAVISLLDLYGPTFYPPDIKSADERYAWGKDHIEKMVGDSRFFHFFAVHEIEAWLLSQPDIFPRAIKAELLKKAGKPETVNFNTPPAKFLDNLYSKHLNRSYKKIANGSQLFNKLDPNTAYQKCPRLKELLDKMLELAKAKQEVK